MDDPTVVWAAFFYQLTYFHGAHTMHVLPGCRWLAQRVGNFCEMVVSSADLTITVAKTRPIPKEWR